MTTMDPARTAAPRPTGAAAPVAAPTPGEITPAAHAAEGPGIHSSNFKFPAGFLWGGATSSHQVEGENRNSDWWAWENSGKTKSGEISGVAADHWNRFDDDFGLLADLGLDTYRLSLSWARLFPQPGMTEPDPEALAHYDAVFESLARRGIRPMVTLHHFVMPQWLTDGNRWETGEAVEDFKQLAAMAAARWGRYVDWWITVNEAEVFVLHGWFRAIFPPGKFDIGLAMQVMANLMKAHASAYHLIKQLDTVDADGDGDPARVGIAQLAVPYEPFSENDVIEAVLANVFENISNTFWLLANETGILDLRIPFGPSVVEEHAPFKDSIDFIGVNYYSRQIVRLDIIGFIIAPPPGAPVRDLDIEIYPDGLYDALEFLSRYKLPMIITENGIADADDSRRGSFITAHLRELTRFKRDHPEVSVFGYIHWALTDNFEWENGFAPRFGLYAVDYATQKRTMRPSAKTLADLAGQYRTERRRTP